MIKKSLFIISFLLISVSLFAQKKIIDKLFSSDTKHNTLIPMPVIGYTQEAGFEFGAAALYSFYIDKEDSLIRPSQIFGIAYTSSKGQSQVSFKSDIWSRANQWHHIYEARFFNLPFNFYGIGDNTLDANLDRITQKRYRLSAEIEKKLSKAYYPGAGIEFESLSFTDNEPGGIYTNNNYIDKDGGRFLFLKLTQLLDTRNSNTYSEKGFYTRLRYGFAPDIFGGNNFNGSLFTADARHFFSPVKKVVIASHAFFETLQSKDDIPFYMLRQMGNDQIMRGYYLGRFREKNYLALQAEFRYRFVERFGLVAFAGTGSVYGKDNFNTNQFKPNYGIGGRFFFDLDKSLALRVDYGFGEKPAGEKRVSGLYISLGEAF